jgi:hypothetical protein
VAIQTCPYKNKLYTNSLKNDIVAILLGFFTLTESFYRFEVLYVVYGNENLVQNKVYGAAFYKTKVDGAAVSHRTVQSEHPLVLYTVAAQVVKGRLYCTFTVLDRFVVPFLRLLFPPAPTSTPTNSAH